jgi:hypothetical protein
MWGFWDGAHWKNNAPLFAQDWSEKPAGRAYRDLVLGRWRTAASGKSDASGTFTTRGFLGDYDVVVSSGSRKKAARAVLGPTGSTVAVILD